MKNKQTALSTTDSFQTLIELLHLLAIGLALALIVFGVG